MSRGKPSQASATLPGGTSTLVIWKLETHHAQRMFRELKTEITQLQTDNAYIEKIAREKFMMVLPGEKVYRVQEIKEY